MTYCCFLSSSTLRMGERVALGVAIGRLTRIGAFKLRVKCHGTAFDPLGPHKASSALDLDQHQRVDMYGLRSPRYPCDELY